MLNEACTPKLSLLLSSRNAVLKFLHKQTNIPANIPSKSITSCLNNSYTYHTKTEIIIIIIIIIMLS